jgi:hypothetical protein
MTNDQKIQDSRGLVFFGWKAAWGTRPTLLKSGRAMLCAPAKGRVRRAAVRFRPVSFGLHRAGMPGSLAGFFRTGNLACHCKNGFVRLCPPLPAKVRIFEGGGRRRQAPNPKYQTSIGSHFPLGRLALRPSAGNCDTNCDMRQKSVPLCRLWHSFEGCGNDGYFT